MHEKHIILTGIFQWLLVKLEKLQEQQLLKKCGTITRCSWCKQWMNLYKYTKVKQINQLDEWRCGNCGGKGLYRFEIGNHLVERTKPPKLD